MPLDNMATNARAFAGAYPRTNARALAGANTSSFPGSNPRANARTLAGPVPGSNPWTNARALAGVNATSFPGSNPRTNARANARSFPGSDPRANARTNARTLPGANSRSVPGSDPRTNTRAVPGANPRTNARANARSFPGSDPRANARTNARTLPGANSRSVPGSDPRTNTRAVPGANPRTNARANARSFPGSDPRANARTNARTLPGANSRSVPGSDPRTNTRAVPGANPRTNTGANARALAGAIARSFPGSDPRANARNIAGANSRSIPGSDPRPNARPNARAVPGANARSFLASNARTVPGSNPRSNPRTNARALTGADASSFPGSNLRTNAGANARTFSGANPWTNARDNARSFAGSNSRANPRANPRADARSIPGSNPKSIAWDNARSFPGSNSRANARNIAGANSRSIPGSDPRTNAGDNARSFPWANPRADHWTYASPYHRRDTRADHWTYARAHRRWDTRADHWTHARAYHRRDSRADHWTHARAYHRRDSRADHWTHALAHRRGDTRPYCGRHESPHGHYSRYVRMRRGPSEVETQPPVTQAPGSAIIQDVVGEARTASPEASSKIDRTKTSAPSIAPTTMEEVPDDPVGTTVSVATVGGVVAATVGTVVGGTATGSTSVVAGSTAGQGVSSSFRNPSSTMALLLTSQIQFLATLSLVYDDETEKSAVSEFANSLRWVNLWPSDNFSRSVTPQVIADDLEEPNKNEDEREDRGIFSTTISDISSFLFMGNLALFFGFLVVIFTLHILVASGVEAYWLAKKSAQEQVTKAQARGLSFSELSAARSGRRPRLSGGNDGSFRSESSDTTLLPQKMARSQSWMSWHKSGSRRFIDDEEENGEPRMKRANGRMGEISQCREISQSPWLHFPHLELVFLIFAFEGAVTSQVSALKDTNSSKVFYVAAVTLVLYPMLMLTMTARTHRVRVRSDALIVFNPKRGDPAANSTRSVFSKVASSLKKDHSLFAWADKGQWETVNTTEEDTKREATWFRIGFEPLFADFTKAGSWFIVYTLAEWAVLACVGVLVDESAVQLGLFCALHSVTFLILVVCKPFANSLINGMGAAVMATDAACMALLAASADKSDETGAAKRIDTAVNVIQQFALFALVIPLYVDTFFVVWGAVRRRNQRAKNTYSAAEREERDLIRRYALRMWGPTWCRMVGSNIFACMRDTREGIRDPNYTKRERAARSGPNLSWKPRRGGPVIEDIPRRTSGYTASTAYPEHGVGEPRNGTESGMDQPDWSRSGRRPLKDDLPRRRGLSYPWEFPENEADPQFNAGDESMLVSGSTFHRDGRTWGWKVGGPAVDDLPRRNPGFLADYPGHQVPSGVEGKSDPEWKSGRNSGHRRRGGGPVEDDLPRRRAGYSGALGFHPDAASEDSNVGANASRGGGASGRGGDGWKAGGPVEDDLPRRRPYYSVDAAGMLSTPQGNEQSDRQVSGAKRSERHPSGGGPVEDNLPRRRAGYSAFAFHPDYDPAPEDSNVDGTVSDGDGPSGRPRDRWKAGAPVADDLPRRRSGYSVGVAGQRLSSEGDEQSERQAGLDTSSGRDQRGRGPLVDDLPRRRSGYSWQSVAEAATTGRPHHGEDLSTELVPSNLDDLHEPARAFKPAFAGWMDAMHKPVQVDLPRRRSSQFSLPKEGMDTVEARRVESRNNAAVLNGGAEDAAANPAET
eukprot:g17231.t1